MYIGNIRWQETQRPAFANINHPIGFVVVVVYEVPLLNRMGSGPLSILPADADEA